MEDDDREIGWAPRKIRALEDQVSETKARVTALEDSLRKYGVPLVPMDFSAEDEYSPPIGGRKYERDDDDVLDGIPDVHGRTGGVVPRAVEQPVLYPGYQADKAYRDRQSEYETRPNEDEETPRSAYRRGYAKGQANMRLELADSTLREAEQRVRRYMAGHWSAASIRAVITELWGDEVKSPALTGMPVYDPEN